MKLRLNKTVAAVASSALLLMAVPAVGIASASGAASKPTYTIAFQGILSGGSSALGINELNGVKLAVKDWNSVKTHKFNINLITGDDQGDPTVAPSIATQIASNNKVIAVVGPSYSGATVASLPIYGPAKIAVISPSATRVSLTLPDPTATPPVTKSTNSQYGNVFFRVVANDGVQGPADGNYLAKTLKKTNIYVINDASSYGAGLATQVAQQAKSDGATVTTATLPSTTACGNGGTGTNDQITIPSGTQAVFYGGYYCDFAKMTDVVRTAGYKGILMSGDGSEDPHYMSDLSNLNDGKGTLLTCACAQVSNSNIAGKAFNTQYLKAFKTDPGAYSPESFDAANMIFTAMTKVMKVTRSSVLAELHKLTYKGLTKVIKFNSAGDVSSNNVYVYTVQVTNGANGFSATIKQTGSTRP